MAKTQTTCPRCRQPVVAEIEQLIDLNTDPLLKQKFLNGVINTLQCPSCGYEGSVATPLVYHDPEKELLLTFFPPELNLAINEQEKQLGPLINRVMDALPNEKRKAYLLQPQSMLTYQTLIEKILEADGITKEMIEDQQKRLNLLQRLISTPSENRPEIIKNEEALVDVSFFSLLTRLIQSAIAQQDEKSSKELQDVQNALFENTKLGKDLKIQAKDTETAIKALQDAGKEGGLTREKLLDLVIQAPNETQLSTLIGLARSGMDYSFFQLLTQKIDSSKEAEKQRLVDLREKLLTQTQEIDKRLQEEYAVSKNLLETIISDVNIEQAAEKNLSKVDELFIQVLENELAAARKNADLERISKLERVMIIIEKASEPPAEVKLIQDLLGTENDEQLQKMLKEHSADITPELVGLFNNVITQNEGKTQNAQLTEKLKAVYRAVLRFSMEKNLK